jgi:A/G-specific adenine glycosylase
MLQQTTVAAVLPRYEAFLRRFPSLAALARAREESVLAAWSGLGYYARARNLHRAARALLVRHDGRLPADYASLRRLPGFGDYTARALLTLAFGHRTVPLDANIRRVASRYFATARPAASRIEALVSRRRPADSVAALFDLGQLICRPRDPLCGACPLRMACRARALGRVSSFPPAPRKPARRKVHLAVIVLERGGRFLVRKRRSTWLSGLWEFPCEEAPTAAAARRKLEALFGPVAGPLRERVSHSVVNRQIQVSIYSARSLRERRRGGAKRIGGTWLTGSRLERAAVASLTRKILRAAAAGSRREA